MRNLKEKIEKYKITILLSLIIITAIVGIYKIYEIKKELKKEEVKLTQKVHKKIVKKEFEVDQTKIDNLLAKSKYLEIENKTNIKLPFIVYHEKFKINVKTYNNDKNIQLNTTGDIRVKDKQLKNYQLENKKNNKNLQNEILTIKKLLKVKKCSKTTAKEMFIYSDKGLAITFRTKKEFIQFNVIDNQIFIWEELLDVEEDNKYLICKFDSARLFDETSKFIEELSKLK